MRSLFRILGPLEVEGGGALGGPQQRALLRRLLLSPNQVVPVARLVDAVWGETPPARVREALQVYVSHLRKAIPDGAARIRWEQGGYRIAVGEDELDALRFERLVARGRSLLAAEDARGAADALEEALGLWRGHVERAHADDPEIVRLEELRLAAMEDRVEAALALGRHRELVPELEALVVEEPLRERRRRQLMLALYRSGRQADALAVYQDARRALVDELGLEPSAELRELEAAILRQDLALRVEPAEVRARRRLPSPTTPLIGRQREIAQVCELLGGQTRLVTLTGPGGTGKTRVAIQAAYELAERFADGVAFVGLAALRDPDLVLSEIATALEVTDGHDPRVALGEHLRRRNELLVIDNFEQVDEAAPALTALLGDAPDLKLLVTSRRPLRVYGEYEYPVEPLALEDEAVPLFLQRAAAVGRPLTAREPVRDVCLRLDCLPLAIELAAARTRDVSLDDLRSTLPRLEAATGGPSDVPDRQRTLRATIAWSYDRLEPDEQRLFEALGVFAGGCSLEDAMVVAGTEATLLASLVEKSLLRRQEARYRMLETIREFASEKLDERDYADTVRRRHAETFVALAEAGKEVWRTPAEVDWWDRLETERDNARAALRWCLEHEPAAAADLVEGVFRFWYTRGYFEEGARAYERVLETVELEEARRARLLSFAAAFEYGRRNLGRARTLTDESLALQRRLGDPVAVARTLVLLGTIMAEEGKAPEALSFFEESVDLARAAGDEVVLAFTVSHLSHGLLAAMELERLRPVALEALALVRQVGDSSGERGVLVSLGLAALLDGDIASAAARYAEALALARELRELPGLISCVDGIGAAAAFSGRSVEAARLLGAAEAMSTAAEFSLELSERVVHDQAVATLRATLGEEELRLHWQAGSELSSDDAVAEAEATVVALSPEVTRT